jgi:hypothetical protein
MVVAMVVVPMPVTIVAMAVAVAMVLGQRRAAGQHQPQATRDRQTQQLLHVHALHPCVEWKNNPSGQIRPS